MLRLFLFVAAALVVFLPVWHAEARAGSCVVGRVIDGDTFVCTDGTHIRLLQINAPEKNACGGTWATTVLRDFFLQPGTSVGLEYDAVETDRYGRTLAAPIVRGTDGADYNISILMVYVGLAKAAYYGDNSKYLAWARESEAAAREAEWNMWAPGGPFDPLRTTNGAKVGEVSASQSAAGSAADCDGRQGIAEPPPATIPNSPVADSGGGCEAAYPDFCIPSPSEDLNCADITYRRFRVLPPDPHGSMAMVMGSDVSEIGLEG